MSSLLLVEPGRDALGSQAHESSSQRKQRLKGTRICAGLDVNPTTTTMAASLSQIRGARQTVMFTRTGCRFARLNRGFRDQFDMVYLQTGVFSNGQRVDVRQL